MPSFIQFFMLYFLLTANFQYYQQLYETFLLPHHIKIQVVTALHTFHFFIHCELPRHPEKDTGVVYPYLLHEYKVYLFINLLPPKAREPNVPCCRLEEEINTCLSKRRCKRLGQYLKLGLLISLSMLTITLLTNIKITISNYLVQIDLIFSKRIFLFFMQSEYCLCHS